MTDPINEPKCRALFDALRQLKEGDVLTRQNVHDINRLVVHASDLARTNHRDAPESDPVDADVSRIEGFTPGSPE